jgi:hypothetical protein
MKDEKKKHLKALKRKAKLNSRKKNLAIQIAAQQLKIKTGTEFNPLTNKEWKKTRTVKTLLGTKEVPFFDLSFIIQLSTKTMDMINSGIDNSVTEEMVEWFCKSISDSDPLDLPKTRDFSNKIITSSEVYATMDWLMGHASYSWISKRMEWFSKHLHLVNNKKMRLMISQRLSVTNLDYIDADDMQKCSKGLTLKEKLMLSNWQSCESEERYTSINKLETIINNATEDDYIYIYRTFKVRKGRAIRKGMNKNSTTHVEGSGISYSISKTSAINVAWWLHKSTAEKFGITEQQLREHFSQMSHFQSYGETPLQLQDDVHCALGLFKVHKDKIIGMSDRVKEEEVIVHPSDVELIDYKFLNHEDFISSFGVMSLTQTMNPARCTGIAGMQFLHHSLVNRDSWLDVFQYIVSKKEMSEKQLLMEMILEGDCRVGSNLIKEVFSFYGYDEQKTNMSIEVFCTKSSRFIMGLGTKLTGQVLRSVRPASKYYVEEVA